MRKTNSGSPDAEREARQGPAGRARCPVCGNPAESLTVDILPGRKTEDRYYYHGEGRLVCKRLRSKPDAAYFIYRKKP
jgi:YD repeat-containing protein